MKGLDGIQGPMYVGTGCVFRRQALYGYDPPAQVKKKTSACDCLSGWCGGSRHDKVKSKKSNKSENKKPQARTESSIPMFNLEDIEEGLEGRDMTCLFSSIEGIIYYSNQLNWHLCFRL